MSAEPKSDSGTESRVEIPKRLRSVYSKGPVIIEVDEKELLAVLTFIPSKASPVLEEQMIREALESAKIIFGIDEEEIARLSGTKKPQTRALIARGQPPKFGDPPRLEYNFSLDPFEVQIAKDERQKIDYRDRPPLPYAKKGEIVGRLIPGTDPIAGTSVTGNELEAAMEIASGSEPGKNVSFEEGIYYSKIDGGPRLDDKGRIEVAEAWTIQGDIDIRTGNIRYPGKLSIKGVINPGFEVHAKSIYVEGVENRTLLEADEDIVIGGGILGGTVTAGKTIKSRFINNAKITCGGNLDVQLSIVNSEINSSGKVQAQTIIGGTIACLGGVECVNLSSEANRSNVIFGIDPIRQSKINSLIKEKLEVQTKIQQKKDKLEPLLNKLAALSQLKDKVNPYQAECTALQQRLVHTANLDPDTKAFFNERINELKGIIATHENKIQELNQEITRIRRNLGGDEKELDVLKDMFRKLDSEHFTIIMCEEEIKFVPKIIVRGKVLTGTRFSSPRAQLVTRQDMSRVAFYERKYTEKDKIEDQEEDIPPGQPRYRIVIERI
jgi:uncharacterized protein (DUF342 family)